MLVCLCEQDKTEVSVDLSNCFRVATESCHFEKLIALQNLSLGTVKIATVYLEQGSFYFFCPRLHMPFTRCALAKFASDNFV